jgi:hypothetical protein
MLCLRMTRGGDGDEARGVGTSDPSSSSKRSRVEASGLISQQLPSFKRSKDHELPNVLAKPLCSSKDHELPNALAKPLFSSQIQKRRDRDWSECRNHDALVHSKIATKPFPKLELLGEEVNSDMDVVAPWETVAPPNSPGVTAHQSRRKTKQKRKRRGRNGKKQSLVSGPETVTEEETFSPLLHLDAIDLFVTDESSQFSREAKLANEVRWLELQTLPGSNGQMGVGLSTGDGQTFTSGSFETV